MVAYCTQQVPALDGNSDINPWTYMDFYFRGKSFREEYLLVPQLRAVLTCPVMLLTATCTSSMFSDMLDIMMIEEKEIHVVSQQCDLQDTHLTLLRNDMVEWVI